MIAGRTDRRSSIPHPLRPRARGCTLVGRQRHRDALQSALADMRQGRTVAVYLHGSSGAGKTALLRSFLDEQIERGDAVVLAGRCYERESVPYKALDSLIDSLGRYLGRLSRAEVAALLPRDVGSLARSLPLLAACRGSGSGPKPWIRSSRPTGAAPPGLRGLAGASGSAGRLETADPGDR